MAFQYGGWIEVPKSDKHGGGTVRIPFAFETDNILGSDERKDYLEGLYNIWKGMLSDYDESRTGQYGDIIQSRFTSLIDTGFDPATNEPHFGK